MALKVLTKEAKQKAVAKTTTTTSTHLTHEQKLVSEYVELYKEFQASDIKAKTDRMEEIKKELAGTANTVAFEPNQNVIFEAPNGELEYSPRANKKEVTKAEDLLKHLLAKHSPEAIVSALSFTLGGLEKVLSKNELAPFIYESQTGPRKLVSVRTKE